MAGVMLGGIFYTRMILRVVHNNNIENGKDASDGKLLFAGSHITT